MKIYNVKDVDGFFKVIDSCEGKVELITGEGDRLNLKSKLCQYVSLTSLLKSDVEIPELEVVAYEAGDTEKLIRFLMENQ
ncbi:MAG: polya polymerase [Lachnospiraceae bacterium]|nr:polya polymerase [Lachnospiraceae bacterium]